MPVIHRFGPYVFRIQSNEHRMIDQPRHVHSKSARGSAIFWLDPVRLRESQGYNPVELGRLRALSPWDGANS